MSNVADRLAKTREVAEKKDDPRKALSNALEKFRPQLQRALPSHMSVDRFHSVIMGAVSKNADIALCTPESILQSVGQAARMGLEIDVSGHGFLVPYDNQRKGIKICTFIPGWQGLVDLVNRSGRGIVHTGAVFNGDFFDWDLGDRPFIKHRNEAEVESAEQLLYTYAIGHIRGEGGWTPPPIIEVWRSSKIENHLRQYNKVGNRHYAFANENNWIMYARKVPLMQVLKYMPKSAEISKAIEAASRADTGEPMTIDGEFRFGDGDDAADMGAGVDTGPRSDKGSGGATFDELVHRLDSAKKRDDADLILDAARGLEPAQVAELRSLVDKKFPVKA